MAGFSFGGQTSTGGFGAGTSGFGSGGFSFGSQPKTTAVTGLGFGFGAPAASTAAPTFGFGAGAASTAPSFGFGASTTTATSAPAFGFGSTTSSAPTLGFGATSSAAPSFGFGSTATTTSSSLFGGLGGGFGATNSTAGFGGLGGGFGATAPTGFGGLTTSTQPQQQASVNPAADQLAKIAQAVHQPQIFGDERDAVIAKWNQLQAQWGKGKGYYTGQNFVEFKPDNLFCRFKAVGYNCMPFGKNEDGFVSLIIKHPVDMVKPQQQQALDTLQKILGNKQHTVCAEAINPLPENKTELVIYVMDRPTVGPARRVLATDLCNFLSTPQYKQQIMNQLNVESITAKSLSKDQLKVYLDTPVSGINPLLWQQAILDNPDPEKLIPVPLIGFKELHKRHKYQEQQTVLHQQRLDLIAQDLTEFQNKQSNMLAKLDEYKRKHLELSHRLLQVIVRQEICRKQGFAIQADEEQLRVQLEAIQAELNHPTQFKGRLNELMSQIRMQNHLSSSRSDVNYQIDPSMLHELKTLLKQQQEGLTHLIDIVKEDMQDLNVIEQGLTDTASARR